MTNTYDHDMDEWVEAMDNVHALTHDPDAKADAKAQAWQAVASIEQRFISTGNIPSRIAYLKSKAST